MQGRLLPPINGCIQEFPYDNWQVEFPFLKQVELLGVEWLITKNHFLNNPVMVNPHKLQDFPISSVCLDVLVDERIIEEEFLYNTLHVFCERVKNTEINTITIPLLEDSSLENDIKRKAFCVLIAPIADKYPNMNFSFEAELCKEKLEEIESLRKNFFVTYDTGNITSCKLDHSEYIRHFKDKINNVHLKDRTFDARTVKPLTGDTDFDTIFRTLKEVNFEGTFVLQTAREEAGKELDTVTRHKQIFEELYEKYF